MSEDKRRVNWRNLLIIDKVDVETIVFGTLLILLLETYYVITTPSTTLYMVAMDILISIAVLLVVASFYIHQRRKMEGTLRESEEKYKTQFDESLDSIFLADAETGIIIDCNQAATNLFGRTKVEMVGKHQRILHPPEEIEGELSTTFKQHLKEKEGQVLEAQIITKNGEIKHVEIKANVFELRSKKLIQGVFHDITQRKLLEKVLLRQRDIAITLAGAGDLAEAVNLLFDGILKTEEFDCAGFYLFDTKTGSLDMIAHRGLPEGFVKMVSHFEADSPYTKIVREGKALYQTASEFPPPIREEIQSDGIRAVAAIPIHHRGEVIGHLNLASHTHDAITVSTRHLLESVSTQVGEAIVRARTETALRDSEGKFRAISTSAKDAIIMIDVNGNIGYYNQAAEKMFGYTQAEVIGKNMHSLLAPQRFQNNHRRGFGKFRETGQGPKIGKTIEFPARRKDGTEFPMEFSVSPLQLTDKLYVLAIARDVTERKKMEARLENYSHHLEDLVKQRTKQLNDAQEQLVRSERLAAIGEAAAMVGHDLRNPLQAIENATYYLTHVLPLQSTTFSPSPKTLEMLRAIHDSVNYADGIVRSLQEFSTTKKPILAKTDVNGLLTTSLAQAKPPEKVNLLTELGNLPTIDADRAMIQRVFMNIITNAFHAMKKTGGTLTVTTTATRRFVLVSFRDTGVGMSKATMKKLFNPFYTTKAQGMGMGLPICKRFVEGHGGSIVVESEEGKGSVFAVRLPIQNENGGKNH